MYINDIDSSLTITSHLSFMNAPFINSKLFYFVLEPTNLSFFFFFFNNFLIKAKIGDANKLYQKLTLGRCWSLPKRKKRESNINC